MSHLSADLLERARDLVALYPEPRSALIPLCHLAQEQDGWLRPEAMSEIADLCGVTAAEVRGTATFYDMLHTEPVGRHVVAVCTNIACLLNGAAELLEHAEASLGVNAGGTTVDGSVTLEEAERVLIQKALSRYDGNVSHAAKALGISRSALYRRLAVHGL